MEHIDAKIAEYLQALDTADTETSTRPDLTATELHQRIAQFRERKQQYQQVQQVLVASGESQISLTDPGSRSMPVAQGVDVCYTVADRGATVAQVDQTGGMVGRVPAYPPTFHTVWHCS